MHGQGTKKWDDGTTYVGDWKENKMHGQGTKKWDDGTTYVGDFQEDKVHGQGTLTYASGQTYVGEFKEDEKHGQGTHTWPSGHTYVGDWKESLYHGQGTMTWPSGRTQKGIFKSGKYLGKTNQVLERSYNLQRIQLKEQLKTLQLTNDNGEWNELSRWEGHLRSSERINTAVDLHFQDPSDVDQMHLREAARINREKELGNYDEDEEENINNANNDTSEELQWIWNTEEIGSSMVLGNYGMSIEFIEEKNGGDPSDVVWQYGWKNNQYTYDPTAEWVNFDATTNSKLEEHWVSSGFYNMGALNLDTLNVHQGPPKAKWAIYIHTPDVTKVNLATGWYLQQANSRRGRSNGSRTMWMVRRKGALAEFPDDKHSNVTDLYSKITPQVRMQCNRMKEEAMKRKAQMNKMLQLRQNKDCEVARGAHSIAKQTGIHTWTLIWSHVPTRNNGSYDCVGVCAEEYENYGPAAPPLLGALSKFEKTKSIGLYANGK